MTCRSCSLALVMLACFSAAVATAQDKPPAPSAEGLRAALRDLKSGEWMRRERGFNQLVTLGGGTRYYVANPIRHLLKEYPNQSEDIRLALIALLEKENAEVKGYGQRGQRFGEDYSNFYGDVIAAVVTLDDPRSMPALLGAITTGGMVAQALVKLAPASVGPVLQKTLDPDPLVRMSALQVLGVMLAPPSKDKIKEWRSKIKQAFLRGVEDQNAIVRSEGIFGLARLGDEDVIPIIQRLAEHDPFFLPGQAAGGKDLYTVRLDARRALAELKAKSKNRK